MINPKWWSGVVLTSTLVLAVACSESEIQGSLDRVSAQASNPRPVATEVELVSISYNPNQPTWVVVVEPFRLAASGVTSGGGGVLNPGQQEGPGISAQLITVLQQTGNVLVADYLTYRNAPEKIAALIKDGRRGPLLIKGAVTEFSQRSDTVSRGESSGPNIAVRMIPYGIGGLVASGIGTKSANETRSTGMVALDIQMIDPASGLVVASFTADGNFTTVGLVTSKTRWGKTRVLGESAASAIGQATRVAMNMAVEKIHGALMRPELLANR